MRERKEKRKGGVKKEIITHLVVLEAGLDEPLAQSWGGLVGCQDPAAVHELGSDGCEEARVHD